MCYQWRYCSLGLNHPYILDPKIAILAMLTDVPASGGVRPSTSLKSYICFSKFIWSSGSVMQQMMSMKMADNISKNLTIFPVLCIVQKEFNSTWQHTFFVSFSLPAVFHNYIYDNDKILNEAQDIFFPWESIKLVITWHFFASCQLIYCQWHRLNGRAFPPEMVGIVISC